MAWTMSTGRRRSFVFNVGAEQQTGRRSTAARERGLGLKLLTPFADWSTRTRWLAAGSCAHLTIAVLLTTSVIAGEVDSRIALAGYGAFVTGLAFALMALMARPEFGRMPNHLPHQSAGWQQPSQRLPRSAADLPTQAPSELPHSVARLTARMSHDLRTPLNAVIGFSDILRNEVHGPIGHDRYREYAHYIETSGRALLSATEDALAVTALVAQPGAHRLSDLCLGDVLAEALAASGCNLAASASLAAHAQTQVLGHRTAIVQALTRTLQVLCARSGDRVISVRCTQEGGIAGLILSSQEKAMSRKGVSANLPVASAPHGAARSYPSTEEDLGVCLAQALCELQGIRLVLMQDHDGAWCARLSLELAEQQPSLFDAVA